MEVILQWVRGLGLVKKTKSRSTGKLELEIGVSGVNFLEEVTSRSGCSRGGDYEKESGIVGLGVLNERLTGRVPGTWNWDCKPITKVLSKWGDVIDRKMAARGTSLMVYCSSTGGDVGSIPGWGTKIPHAPRRGQKVKTNKQKWKGARQHESQRSGLCFCSWPSVV